jgi:hypothetical protein
MWPELWLLMARGCVFVPNDKVYRRFQQNIGSYGLMKYLDAWNRKFIPMFSEVFRFAKCG